MAAVMWSVGTLTSTLVAAEAKPRATDGAAHVVYDAKRDILVFVEQHHLRYIRHTGSSSEVEVLLKPRGAVRALLLDASSGDLLVATDFAIQRLRRDDSTSRGYAESLEPWVGDAAAVKGAFADGSGDAARFGGITALAWDRDANIVVSDAANYRIRTVTPAGMVSTRCGSGLNKCQNGAAAVAGFVAPNALAFLDGTLYIADDTRIRKLTPEGEVQTVCGGEFPGLLDDTKDPDAPAMMKPSFGMVADAGVIYFTQDHAVRRFNPAKGLLTTMCGGGVRGSEDEIGVRARFSSPGGLFLYSDAAGLRGSSAPGTPLASPAPTPRGAHAAPPPLALPTGAPTMASAASHSSSSGGGRPAGEVKTPLLGDARKFAEPTVWLLVADTLNHSIRRVALSGTPTPASRLATDALDSDIKSKPKLDNQRNRCCCSGSS